ncbi:MAG: serpin family protein, partial [Planctomycetota bacterium]
RQVINTWVEEQTAEKITDLVPPGAVSEVTRLILTNAVYFKAEWVEQFDGDGTRPADFRMSADETIEVPTMHQAAHFGYAEDDAVQVLQMGYVGDEASMLVVLPKDPAGLAEVEHALIEARGLALLADIGEREVRVALPKFRMTWEADLAAMLADMGMVDAFGANADFSRMSPQADREPFSISGVIHKAYVNVNETGTEAAAATAVIMMGSAPGEPPVEFTADHPFLFMIRHEQTGAILFLGRVVNPAAEEGDSEGSDEDDS